MVRHGESEYNEQGVWTGTTDVGLTTRGRAAARQMGLVLRDIAFERIYTSCLKRASQTRDEFLTGYGETTALLKKTAALNERDYGDYTGLNKWEIRDRVGAADFAELRRAFDAVIPNGESLRDVWERVVPWYCATVVPVLLSGGTILVIGHGNSNRALRKYIEQVDDEAVKQLEMDFDKIYIYRTGPDGIASEPAEIRRIPS